MQAHIGLAQLRILSDTSLIFDIDLGILDVRDARFEEGSSALDLVPVFLFRLDCLLSLHGINGNLIPQHFLFNFFVIGRTAFVQS